MKRYVCLVLVSLVSSFANAQDRELAICTDKTITVIAPFPIKHVDLGSPDILAHQVETAGNILLLKAASKNFHPTNLTIVTEDNSVYSFSVGYEDNPITWIHRLTPQSTPPHSLAQTILHNDRNIRGLSTCKGGVCAVMNGIYVKSEVIYLHMQLQNSSPISYDIDLIRMYHGVRQKSRRTAKQELEIKPVTIVGNKRWIAAKGRNTLVIAIPKLALSKGACLVIEFAEKNGNRTLTLKVNHRKMLSAVMLPNQ